VASQLLQSGDFTFAESARGISPRAAHRFRTWTSRFIRLVPPREGCRLPSTKEFLRCPVDSITTWVTCLLRSTGVTPLPRYYEAVRPWPAPRYFPPRGASTCAFSLPIASPVLKFRTKAHIRVMPPIRRTPHGQ